MEDFVKVDREVASQIVRHFLTSTSIKAQLAKELSGLIIVGELLVHVDEAIEYLSSAGATDIAAAYKLMLDVNKAISNKQ